MKAFEHTGAIKGIHVRFLESHRVVLLAYHDFREAAMSPLRLKGKTLYELALASGVAMSIDVSADLAADDRILEAGWISMEKLESVSIVMFRRLSLSSSHLSMVQIVVWKVYLLDHSEWDFLCQN